MICKRKQNPPRRHHYLPEFYLQRWANSTGQLTEFQKLPTGKLSVKPKFPRATAFEMDGYTSPGLAPTEAQHLELEFFGPIDSDAATVMNKLDLTKGQVPSEREDRLKWARFLVTMMMRSPEDVAAIKAGVAKAWRQESPERRAKYEKEFPLGDWPTFDDFLARTTPEYLDQVALKLFKRLLDSDKMVEEISKMLQFFVQLEPGQLRLVTSDRPIYVSSHLMDPDYHIVLPVSEDWVYVAARSWKTHLNLVNKGSQFFRDINKGCVQRAVKFVYTKDEDNRPFIEKHFGKKPVEPFMSALQRLYEASKARGVLPSQHADNAS